MEIQKEKFQRFGWNSNFKIFQPNPKIFPLGSAATWYPETYSSRSHCHFSSCPTIKLIFLFPDKSCCITRSAFPNSWWDTHTGEMNGDPRLCNTNKFPHQPSSLSRWKHFGFQAIGFKKNVSLESKPFFKVSLIENLWFLSTGSFETAIWFQLVEKIPLLSTIPDSRAAWVRLAISSNTSKAF